MADTQSYDVVPEEPPADLGKLMEIAAQAGLNALTPEEYALLQAAIPATAISADDHGANLALFLDQDYLNGLADDIIHDIDLDEESRSEWKETAKAGLKALGLNPAAIKRPKAWMSKAVHPLVKEAIIQFEARAIAEVWPKKGPAAAVVLGSPVKETQEQAIRVADYLNYLYVREMPGAFEEEELMLWWIAFAGSAFKKAYYCPIQGQVMSVTVSPHNFIVPYDAKNLRSSPRYAERYFDTHIDHALKIASGLYREVDYDFKTRQSPDRGDVQKEVDSTEGRTNIGGTNDRTFERYEANVYLDLPGFESPDGVPLPYAVVVDRLSMDVLSVRRAWKANDPKKRREQAVTHYKFLPGPGFYGWGFTHTIGSLGESATRALQNLLDAGFLNNAQGGYTSRHTPLGGKTKVTEMEYGVYTQVDITPEQLSKAFFPFPIKPPDATLFKLLGYLDDVGRRFASTAEAMVGESSPGTPVGTTLALIEQGSKVLSGVHRRLHVAKTEELKIVAELCADRLPPVYPYFVEGQDRAVKKTDFDERVDVVPVSDPEKFSSTQRVAQAQSQLQLATQFPQYHDVREALKRMHTAIGTEGIEAVLPPEPVPEPMDPVSEFMALLMGKPVKAFPEQDHVAYMAALTQAFMALDTETQKRIEPTYRPLLQEHQAFYYQQQVAAQLQQMGLPPEAMQQPGVERFMAMVKPSMLLPFPDDAKQAALDYSVLKEEERKDIRVAGEMRRKEMLAQQQVAVQGEQQSLALANQRMQHENTLDYTAMVHRMDLMAKQLELLMKMQQAEEADEPST